MPRHIPVEDVQDVRQSAPGLDTREQLTRTTVNLHWLVAISMILMLAFGLYLDQLPKGEGKSSLVQLHKSLGMLVLVLIMARLIWRARQGLLRPLGEAPRWQELASKTSHYFLLFGTFAMPFTGIMRSLGGGRPIDMFGFPFIPKLVSEKSEPIATIGSLGHKVIAYAMLAVIFVHIAAALKHHFFDHDGTLQRMLGSRVA